MMRVLNRKGLGTVIGTVIFLLIAVAVIGALLIIGYKEQLANMELSQAQTISSLKSQEQLQVTVNNLVVSLSSGTNLLEKEVIITNKGTVASHLLYLVIIPVGSNGQIAGPPVKAYPLNVTLQPGQSYTMTINLSLLGLTSNSNVTYGVITAYGNIFWS